MADETAAFYWCLRHQRVETTDRCGADLRMGPYGSEAEARRYAETAAQRDEAWQREDEEWEGGS